MYYTKKRKIYPIKKKYTKSNYKTISKFEDELEKEMKIKMNSPEGKKMNMIKE